MPELAQTVDKLSGSFEKMIKSGISLDSYNIDPHTIDLVNGGTVRFQGLVPVDSIQCDRMYGGSFKWLKELDLDYGHIVHLLMCHASQGLPVGTPVDLRRAEIGDYGRTIEMAWLFDPFIQPEINGCDAEYLESLCQLKHANDYLGIDANGMSDGGVWSAPLGCYLLGCYRTFRIEGHA